MKSLHTLLSSVLIVGSILLIPGSQARAQLPTAGKDSAPGFLNPDGTLQPDGGSRSPGQRGWDVRLDPHRGPVFEPAEPAGPELVLPGHWAALGSNGAGDGSINGPLFSVCAVAVSGTNVYVGGNFTNVNNNGTVLNAADYVARWDGTRWWPLGNNGAGDGAIPPTGGTCPVETIAVSGNNVYVGGTFENVNNKGTVLNAADYLAKWDGTNWSALGSDGTGEGAISCCSVMALAVDGSSLYVGGNFFEVYNGSSAVPEASGIARWNGSSWSGLGDDGAGGGSLNGWVKDIAISGGNLYAVGSFDDLNNHGAVIPEGDYIARWDGANWFALGGNGSGGGSFNTWPNDIAVSGNNVYVAGLFTDVNNQGTVLTAADYIARWNGSNWSALGSNGAGNGSLQYGALAVAVSGSDVYAGGYFLDVNNRGTVIKAADRIAKWNGTDWAALSSGAGGDGSINGPHVADIQIAPSGIYVGGWFQDIDEHETVLTAADNIARYRPPTPHSASFRSLGAQDGWVLESIETSSRGGAINSAGTVFNLGDDAADRQYRSILSFNTAGLPNNAIIGKVTLKIKRQGLVGTNPFTTHGGLRVDIRKPYFGTGAGLAAADFQAAASLSGAGTFNKTPAAGWYTAVLSQAAFRYVNVGGTTQLRLRFVKDDNDDRGADYMKFFSGNVLRTADRPVLVVQYYVP